MGVLVLAAGPAAAQERSPAARGELTELARVLGESHALRQGCYGAEDQFWRQRMKRLLEVEAAEEGLKRRLSESFNAGYAAGQSLFPACSAASRQEARRLARRGQALAQGLAGP